MALTLGSLMLWLSQDAPLITADSLCMIKEVPASVDTTIGGKEIADPVVYVTDAGISNMGTGFVQGNTLQSLQNIGTVLQAEVTEGKTWLDATNAVANAVLYDRNAFSHLHPCITSATARCRKRRSRSFPKICRI